MLSRLCNSSRAILYASSNISSYELHLCGFVVPESSLWIRMDKSRYGTHVQILVLIAVYFGVTLHTASMNNLTISSSVHIILRMYIRYKYNICHGKLYSSRNDETPRETTIVPWQMINRHACSREKERKRESVREIRLKTCDWKLHFARRIHAIEFEEDRTKKREKREMADSSNEDNSQFYLREFNPRNKWKKQEEEKKKEKKPPLQYLLQAIKMTQDATYAIERNK